jgi:hypothetical protein
VLCIVGDTEEEWDLKVFEVTDFASNVYAVFLRGNVIVAFDLDGKGSSGEKRSVLCFLKKSAVEIGTQIIRDRNGTSDKCDSGKEVLCKILVLPSFPESIELIHANLSFDQSGSCSTACVSAQKA